MKKNLHIIASSLHPKGESRTTRSVNTIYKYNLFDEVLVIGLKEQKDETAPISINPIATMIGVYRNLDLFKASFLQKSTQTLIWSLRVYSLASKLKFNTINCHSLSLLPLSVALKVRMKAKLIYDIHELETEVAGATFLRKYLSKFVEFLLIRFADRVIVVSEPIQDWYENTYSLNNVHVIKNMPSIEKKLVDAKSNMRKHFNIPDEHIIFVHHGALVEDRGIDLLLDSFKEIEDKKKHLVLIGFGPFAEMAKDYEKKFENIHFHKTMKKDELLLFLKGANVGINLIENNCLNHEYCLPNKLWDYLALSIPVLVNDLVGMRAIIEEYDCGWYVEGEKDKFKKKVMSLTKEEILVKSNDALLSQDKWGWHFEEEKLVSIYNSVNSVE